jgi:hypothetical protein
MTEAGGATRALGSASLVAAAALAGIAAGYAISNAIVADQTAKLNAPVERGLQTTNVAMNLLGKARSGTLTGADLSAAQEEQKRAEKDVKNAKWQATEMEKAPGWVPGHDEQLANRRAELKSAETSFAQLNAAIKIATQNLHDMGQQASNANPGAPQRNGPR